MSNTFTSKRDNTPSRAVLPSSNAKSPKPHPFWKDNRQETSAANLLQRAANPKAITSSPPQVITSLPNRKSEGVVVKSQEARESTVVDQKKGVVQRAITVGMSTVPRTVNLDPTTKNQLLTEGLFAEFERMNSDREKIYIFQDENHLIGYLRNHAGATTDLYSAAPIVHQVSSDQLDEGHKRAQDIRFNSIFQPNTQQISATATGAHSISSHMMPPPGSDHHWGQMPTPGSQEYVLYHNHLQPPTSQTLPLTFGNPLSPSLVMNQGNMTMGMHIQPTSAPYLSPITRSQTSYAGLPSEPGRVRGHPFALEQNQISTDNPASNFDNDPRTYTSESDSTKANGGISSWRYNEVEKKSFQSGMPFTQVNNDSVIGGMGIGQPSSMHYRMASSSTTHTDLHMDNSATVDYRGTDSVRPKGMGKQAYQTEMGKTSALSNPYPQIPIHRPGQDFMDPDRHNYPGYMSPPPTPFLSSETLADPEEIEIYPIAVHVGSRVKLSDGREGQVTEIISRDHIRQKAQCKVMVLNPTTSWNPSGF